MEEAFKQNGDFSWAELRTNDGELAKDFYNQLLGWTTEEMVINDAPYTVFKSRGEPVAGMAPIPSYFKSSASKWGNYICVDNVDAVAKLAEELGGTTLQPLTDIPGVGRTYVFEDPQGAVLGLITYFRE